MPINLFGGSTGDSDSERLGGGRLHAGMLDDDGDPVALTAWRFTTADPEVADAIAELGDSEVTEMDTEREEIYQVLTKLNSLHISIAPDGIFTSLVLWGNNQKVAETDGHYLIEDGVVTDKVSPLTADKPLDEVLAMGFKPSIRVYFTLTDLPDAGSFVFFSGSKTALEEFSAREAQLVAAALPATTTLELEEITTKKGRTFTKPRMGRLAYGDDEVTDDSVESNEEAAEETEAPKPATKKTTAKKVAKKATRKRTTKKG